MGKPSVYPMGVTIYHPEKCFNGYTLFPAAENGAMLINMNGKVEKLWEGLQGMPNKLLPNGQVMGHLGRRDGAYGYQDYFDVAQVDWNGQVIWSYNQHEYIEDPENEPRWMARQHHDYQREGNPVGYYVPEMDYKENGTTLILAHQTIENKKISPHLLLDDCLYEVDWQGNKIWQWQASDHFDEFGFTELEKMAIYKNPNIQRVLPKGTGDWLHINCASYLGPNKWYDLGDERFHPDNIIFDSREANLMAILEKSTGKIVWQIGPNFSKTGNLEPVIGPHHTHMIPKGLPGEGNVLVFDNGGWGGYGAPTPEAPKGLKTIRRDHSRVIEFDPITLEIKWQFSAKEMGLKVPVDAYQFYSALVSSAQRLPNGNTLITEGGSGRLLEVTTNHEIVWEYISPYGKGKNSMIYRAYRYPYDWVPQLEKPVEKEIIPPDNQNFRLENASGLGYDTVTTKVASSIENVGSFADCVESL